MINRTDKIHDSLWRNLLPSSLILLFGMTILAGCATADLRNDALQERGSQAQQRSDGERIMRETAENHGYAAWKEHQTVEMVMRDNWEGFTTWLLGRPWDNELLNFTYELGTFNGRVEMLDGDDKGKVYGIHSWQGYEVEPGETLEKVEQERTDFVIPAILFLNELPFRLVDAPIIVHMADSTLNGENYSLLFATWDREDAHTEHDQYILWINKATGLLDFAEYTIREQFKFATGAAVYEDYRDIDGVQVPFNVTLNAAPDDDPDDFYHKITIESAAFNVTTATTLHVFDDLTEIGDAKRTE